MTKKKNNKVVGGVLFALAVVGLYLAAVYLSKTFRSNVDLKGNAQISVYIPTGASLQKFQSIVRSQGFLRNDDSFWAMARQLEFAEPRPGHYVVRDGMSNYSLIKMFRGGHQTPIQLRVPSARTPKLMAARLAKQIEAPAEDIARLLADSAFLAPWGFRPETAIALFVPDTYEMYWNQSAESLLQRLYKEYQRYWNKKRLAAAADMGMTPHQVATLASIVQAEQSRFDDEKPTIAGLYINRLRVGQRLESDPTVVFANGNFAVQRVLRRDKRVQSPYNTYKNTGLPPGPILAPEKSSIDAVLQYERHEYFFMCAKDDFSGRHYFARTHEQHMKYAQLYREALDRRGIKR